MTDTSAPEPDLPATDPEPFPAADPGRRRADLHALLELFALTGLAVAQPLLDIIGDAPTFLIFHGLQTGGTLLLVGLVTLVPPLVLWGVGLLAGLVGRRARVVVHRATLALLLLALAVQVGKHLTPVRGVALMALAATVAATVIACYCRWRAARSLTRYAAVGPLVFALLFTFTSPASAVIFTDDPAAGGEVRHDVDLPPIVMVVLDELPTLALLDSDAGIDADRFPNFARLAADSTWYRNSTTVTGWTPFAMPAMLSGNLPTEFVAPHHSQYTENMFTLFGPAYDMEVHESVTALCPPAYCDSPEHRGGLATAVSEVTGLLGELLLPVETDRDPHADFAEPTVGDRADPPAGEEPGADLDDPAFMFDHAHDNQPYRFSEFRDQLAAAGDDPALHFLHLLLPHVPWTYLPSGVRYHDQAELPLLPDDDPWWAWLSTQRLDLQLEYTDRLLGEILDVLERTGRYQDALVVVTADHGITLDPRAPVLSNGRELAPGTDRGIAELAWVPTFIKEPGQTDGVVEDRNWQHIDLLPTVADIAGVEVPWDTDGVSWVRRPRDDPAMDYLNTMSDRRIIDGAATFEEIITDPDAIPDLPPPPMPDLVGTPVSDRTVEPTTATAQLADPDHFQDLSGQDGTVPALIHGELPELPLGTPVALAVNGVVGAVAPVADDQGQHRFAALVEDASLFRPGDNRVELFEVADDGETLLQLEVTW